MTVTSVLLWDGAEEAIGETSRIARKYRVDIGVNDEDQEYTAIAYMAAATSPVFSHPVYGGVFYRDEIKIDSRPTQRVWIVSVSWTTRKAEQPAAPEAQPDYPPEVSVSVGTTAQHITESIERVGSYNVIVDAPEYPGIGFDGKSINGTDILVPTMEFTETYTRDRSALNYPTINALMLSAGRIMSEPFRGFAVGEVLYKGCDISLAGENNNKVKFTYHFAVMPNVYNLNFGLITVTTKRGWDYLWIKYMDHLDPTTNVIFQIPEAVYVERVYEEVAMSILGLTDESAWATIPEESP